MQLNYKIPDKRSDPGTMSVLPVPILTSWGMLGLASGSLIPLSGIFINMPLDIGLLLVALLLLSGVVVLVREYLLVKEELSKFQWNINAPDIVYSGKVATIVLEITRVESHSSTTCWHLTLRPEYNSHVKAIVETVVTTLDSSSIQRLNYDFLPLVRGTAKWMGFYGRILPDSRLCFWQFRYVFNQPVEVRVLPNHSLDGSKKDVGLQRNLSGERKIRSASLQGREFEALRPYSVGDDLRKVDWKRSAKGKGLLVKVYRPETHQRIQLAIDCGRRMGNLLGERLQLEYATDAAAGLTFLANKNNDEVGLFAFHHKVIKKTGISSGPRQVSRIIQSLVELSVGEVESDYQLVGDWAHQSTKRSLLVLITSASNPAGLEQIGRSLLPVRGRHLPIIFSIADRDLIDLSQNAAVGLDDAYIIAAAREQLKKIEEKRAILEKSGIPCVYCDAAALHSRLVNKYNELKISGRL